MRLLFVSSVDENSGTRTRVVMLSRALSTLGHSVCVIEPNSKISKRGEFSEQGVSFVQLPQHRSAIGFFFSTVSRLREALEHKADVVVAVKAFPMGCIPAFFKARLQGIPFVLDWDDFEAAYLRARRKTILYYPLLFFERWIVKRADALSLHSDFLFQKALEFGVNRKKIFFVQQGVDTVLFNPDEKPARLWFDHEKLLVYVASLGFTSDLDRIIDFVSPVLQGHAGTKLLVVGGGPRLEFYKQLIKHKGLSKSVFFSGKVPVEKVPSFITAADVCLLYMEPCEENLARSSLKLLEYMACGKPVVCNGIGETKKLLKNNENSLVADNAAGYARSVEKLLSSPPLGEKLGSRALATAQKHSWRESARGFNSLLQKFS